MGSSASAICSAGCGIAQRVSMHCLSLVRAQAEKHASDAIVRGPLPEAVRQATERFRDVNDGLAAGYVQMEAA
jgi:hypothetical protein